MSKTHSYTASTQWTGNQGTGNSNYRTYERSHTIAIPGKADLLCSSDPAFRGDKTKHNPEDLLVASISGCHMLWYLHVCSDNGVIVTNYIDQAVGVMAENQNGSGQFTEVILSPQVTVQDASMIEKANALHDKAHSMCFIARSLNFPVHHKPSATAEK
jgi:organic hydroperoxide reductase OsmC/OhrA